MYVWPRDALNAELRRGCSIRNSSRVNSNDGTDSKSNNSSDSNRLLVMMTTATATEQPQSNHAHAFL